MFIVHSEMHINSIRGKKVIVQKRMCHFMYSYVHIITLTHIAMQKMFPRNINPFGSYVSYIQLFILFHIIGIGQDINIFKMRKKIILQAKSYMYSRSEDKGLGVIILFKPDEMKVFGRLKMMNPLNEIFFPFRRKIIEIGD